MEIEKIKTALNDWAKEKDRRSVFCIAVERSDVTDGEYTAATNAIVIGKPSSIVESITDSAGDDKNIASILKLAFLKFYAKEMKGAATAKDTQKKQSKHTRLEDIDSQLVNWFSEDKKSRGVLMVVYDAKDCTTMAMHGTDFNIACGLGNAITSDDDLRKIVDKVNVALEKYRQMEKKDN